MDFGDIAGNVPIIVMIIGLILLQFFLRRRRKPETTHQEIAQSLLAEVTLNLSLVGVFRFHWRVKKFETVSWQRNKTKLDFLDQSLQVVLSDTFIVVEDFNRQVDAARKYKSASYLASINLDKLKESLTKSQQGLEQWLLSAVGIKESPPKYPGMFDEWLGKG